MIALEITVVGTPDVLHALDKLQGTELNRRMKEGTHAGATVVLPDMRANTPVRTGAMRRGTSVRQLRSGIGADVGPRAWYRHFVIRGTSRGVRANPYVGRVAERARPLVAARVAEVIVRGRPR